jgi:hypothetical protein
MKNYRPLLFSVAVACLSFSGSTFAVQSGTPVETTISNNPLENFISPERLNLFEEVVDPSLRSLPEFYLIVVAKSFRSYFQENTKAARDIQEKKQGASQLSGEKETIAKRIERKQQTIDKQRRVFEAHNHPVADYDGLKKELLSRLSSYARELNIIITKLAGNCSPAEKEELESNNKMYKTYTERIQSELEVLRVSAKQLEDEMRVDQEQLKAMESGVPLQVSWQDQLKSKAVLLNDFINLKAKTVYKLEECIGDPTFEAMITKEQLKTVLKGIGIPQAVFEGMNEENLYRFMVSRLELPAARLLDESRNIVEEYIAQTRSLIALYHNRLEEDVFSLQTMVAMSRFCAPI